MPRTSPGPAAAWTSRDGGAWAGFRIDAMIVVAFVVLQPGAATDAAALDAHCLRHIARFKRPKRYLFVDALAKNNYGKVLKTELRERLRG